MAVPDRPAATTWVQIFAGVQVAETDEEGCVKSLQPQPYRHFSSVPTFQYTPEDGVTIAAA